jgi:CheY-like chemotaxis protein
MNEKLLLLRAMNQPFNILLVEDNYEHLRLTKYILREQGIPGEVFIARDGQEAMDFLYQRNQFADVSRSPRPQLVLLDLNIPRINGRELLKIIKNDNSLQGIPVVVMSSSDREEDIVYARQLGAAAYISKADGFERLSQALSDIQRFTAGSNH